MKMPDQGLLLATGSGKHCLVARPRGGICLRQAASFEPSCVFERRSIRLIRDAIKKLKERPQIRYIVHWIMRACAPIQLVALEVCTFHKVPNVVKRDILFCLKWRYLQRIEFKLLPQETAIMAIQQCRVLPRWCMIMHIHINDTWRKVLH